MARLFADENFPRAVVEGLRALGHDVVTLQETGEGGTAVSDEDVLGRASAAGRAVVTLNRRHFIVLHRAGPTHEGIVVCTIDPDFLRQDARIDAAIASVGSLAGRLVRVKRPDG